MESILHNFWSSSWENVHRRTGAASTASVTWPRWLPGSDSKMLSRWTQTIGPPL